MEQIAPAFRLVLNTSSSPRKAVVNWAVYECNPDKRSPSKYRIMNGRAWIGGKRERATFYTYLEVMRLWELATAKALGIHIPCEPDPEDYPIRQKVRIADSVARDKLGAGYDISWIRSKPREDQKSGGFKVYVAGYKQMINLRHLTPVEPGKAGYRMVREGKGNE